MAKSIYTETIRKASLGKETREPIVSALMDLRSDINDIYAEYTNLRTKTNTLTSQTQGAISSLTRWDNVSSSKISGTTNNYKITIS